MPAANDRQQEPSMEEILASIRRIISEDGEDGEGKPAATAEPDGVLELTEMVAEGGEVVSLRDQARKHERSDMREASPAKSREAPPAKESMREEPSLTAPAQVAPVQAAPATGKPGLMSEEREAAAVAAMGGLLDAVQDDTPAGGSKTVDEIARELMRPMLRSWLDENLPVLVERLVKDEIERVVGRARGR